MKQAFEIVNEVLTKRRGLPAKLARVTGKYDTYFRAQGYEPRTLNPEASGANSPVADYMTYCELYEAADPGAGWMLSTRVNSELEERFTECGEPIVTQSDLHVTIEDETCDVRKWLASFKIETASARQLRDFEGECDEAIQAILDAKSTARARRVRVGLEERTTAARNGR